MHMRCNQNLSTFHSHTHHHHHSMVAISDKNSNTNQTRDIGQCYKYLVEFWFFNFFSNKMCNTNAATFIAALPMVKIPSNTCKAHSHGSNTRPKKMPTVFSYVSHYIHARTRIRLFNNDAIKKKCVRPAICVHRLFVYHCIWTERTICTIKSVWHFCAMHVAIGHSMDGMAIPIDLIDIIYLPMALKLSLARMINVGTLFTVETKIRDVQIHTIGVATLHRRIWADLTVYSCLFLRHNFFHTNVFEMPLLHWYMYS